MPTLFRTLRTVNWRPNKLELTFASFPRTLGGGTKFAGLLVGEGTSRGASQAGKAPQLKFNVTSSNLICTASLRSSTVASTSQTLVCNHVTSPRPDACERNMRCRWDWCDANPRGYTSVLSSQISLLPHHHYNYTISLDARIESVSVARWCHET
jgi:hypothetical protein